MRPRFVFVGDIVRSAHISYFFDADIRWPGEFEEIPTDTSKLSTINASTFDGEICRPTARERVVLASALRRKIRS
jgi:hypothetical protein